MSRTIARHRRFNAAASRAKTLRPIAGRIRCAGRAAGARGTDALAGTDPTFLLKGRSEEHPA